VLDSRLLWLRHPDAQSNVWATRRVSTMLFAGVDFMIYTLRDNRIASVLLCLCRPNRLYLAVCIALLIIVIVFKTSYPEKECEFQVRLHEVINKVCELNKCDSEWTLFVCDTFLMDCKSAPDNLHSRVFSGQDRSKGSICESSGIMFSADRVDGSKIVVDCGARVVLVSAKEFADRWEKAHCGFEGRDRELIFAGVAPWVSDSVRSSAAIYADKYTCWGIVLRHPMSWNSLPQGQSSIELLGGNTVSQIRSGYE
jgi:hypothetical protein